MDHLPPAGPAPRGTVRQGTTRDLPAPSRRSATRETPQDRRRTVNADSGSRKQTRRPEPHQEPSMGTSATLPSTIQIRPSRLAGLLVAVAILTGFHHLVRQPSHDRGPRPQQPQVHRGVDPRASRPGHTSRRGRSTPEQRSALFGRPVRNPAVRAGRQWARPRTASSHLGQRLPDPSVRQRRHRPHPQQRQPPTETCTRPRSTRTPLPPPHDQLAAATFPFHRIAPPRVRLRGRGRSTRATASSRSSSDAGGR